MKQKNEGKQFYAFLGVAFFIILILILLLAYLVDVPLLEYLVWIVSGAALITFLFLGLYALLNWGGKKLEVKKVRDFDPESLWNLIYIPRKPNMKGLSGKWKVITITGTVVRMRCIELDPKNTSGKPSVGAIEIWDLNYLKSLEPISQSDED